MTGNLGDSPGPTVTGDTVWGESLCLCRPLSLFIQKARMATLADLFLPHSCYTDPVRQHRNASETSFFHVNVTTIISVMQGCHKGHMEKKSECRENQKVKKQSSGLGASASALLGFSALVGSKVQWLQRGGTVRSETPPWRRKNQSKG